MFVTVVRAHVTTTRDSYLQLWGAISTVFEFSSVDFGLSPAFQRSLVEISATLGRDLHRIF